MSLRFFPSPPAGEGGRDAAASRTGEGSASAERTPHPAPKPMQKHRRSWKRRPEAAYATFSHKGRRKNELLPIQLSDSLALRAKMTAVQLSAGAALDRFVASLLAATANAISHSRGAILPGLLHHRVPRKIEGAGKTGCRLAPAASRVK